MTPSAAERLSIAGIRAPADRAEQLPDWYRVVAPSLEMAFNEQVSREYNRVFIFDIWTHYALSFEGRTPDGLLGIEALKSCAIYLNYQGSEFVVRDGLPEDLGEPWQIIGCAPNEGVIAITTVIEIPSTQPQGAVLVLDTGCKYDAVVSKRRDMEIVARARDDVRQSKARVFGNRVVDCLTCEGVTIRFGAECRVDQSLAILDEDAIQPKAGDGLLGQGVLRDYCWWFAPSRRVVAFKPSGDQAVAPKP
jgi:hypothetical protein